MRGFVDLVGVRFKSVYVFHRAKIDGVAIEDRRTAAFTDVEACDLLVFSARLEEKSRTVLFSGINHIVEEALVSGAYWEEELQIVTAKGRTLWVKAMGKADVIDGKCIRLY